MSLYTIRDSRNDSTSVMHYVYGGTIEVPDTMTQPVLCRCGQVYDLHAVHVTARHADCSVWSAPCCNRQADDRPGNSLPDYTHLTRLLA